MYRYYHGDAATRDNNMARSPTSSPIRVTIAYSGMICGHWRHRRCTTLTPPSATLLFHNIRLTGDIFHGIDYRQNVLPPMLRFWSPWFRYQIRQCTQSDCRAALIPDARMLPSSDDKPFPSIGSDADTLALPGDRHLSRESTIPATTLYIGAIDLYESIDTGTQVQDGTRERLTR